MKSVINSCRLYFLPKIEKHKIYSKLSDPDTVSEHDKETVEIHIFSLKCASCAANVERLLKDLHGIVDASVNFVTKIAYITYDKSFIGPQQILKVIKKNSHTAMIGALNTCELTTIYFKCQQNIWHNQYLNSLTNYKITHLKFKKKTHFFKVEYSKKNIGIREIYKDLQKICDCLEIVEVSDVIPSQNTIEVRNWWNNLLLSSIFGIATMVLMIFEHITPRFTRTVLIPGLSYSNLVLFLCSTIVQFGVGRFIYISALRSIRTGINMDFLISVATTVAYTYSCVILGIYIFKKIPTSPHTFFETPPMLYMIVCLGRYIECKGRKHTVAYIKNLMKLNTQSVTILYKESDNTNYLSMKISSDLIEENDVLKVFHGMCLPCDGVISEPNTVALVNEAVITGESIPVQKKAYDDVFCGSINEGNPFNIKVTRTGEDCRVNQITRCVQKALNKKIPLNNIVDVFSRFFTPGIVFLSILTFSVWIICFKKFPYLEEHLNIDSYLTFSLQTAISVLCVACPCTIGLAIPLAVMNATGKAAKHGAIVKGGPPIQLLSEVETIVWDKTGTLTQGVPLVEFFEHENISPDNVNLYYQAIYSLVSFSNHILSRCIAKYFEILTLPQANIQEYQEIPGLGLSGKLTFGGNTMDVVVGNEEMMKIQSIKISETMVLEAGSHASDGATIVFTAVDHTFIGYFVVRDEIRPDAKYTVHILSIMGINSIMLTGDKKECAEYVAKKIGITEFYFGQSPEKKSEVIQKLTTTYGHSIAMVGDGVNDAIAMAQSDVGISMGNQVNLTAETANIVIMNNKLFSIPNLILLSRLTMRTIKRNLVLSFIYNLLAIPVAAGCLVWAGVDIQPWVASVAMVVSSLSVTFCSWTIMLFQPPFDGLYQP